MPLTHGQARKIVDGCIEKAQSLGLQQCIVIVDQAGNLVTADRMDGAGLQRDEFARGKAFAAAFFRRKTSDSGKLLESNPALFHGALSMFQGRMLLVGGGVPIQVEGQVVGGVGVSGGTAEQDEEVALAGLKALETGG